MIQEGKKITAVSTCSCQDSHNNNHHSDNKKNNKNNRNNNNYKKYTIIITRTGITITIPTSSRS
jgi:hypothetical protein